MCNFKAFYHDKALMRAAISAALRSKHMPDVSAELTWQEMTDMVDPDRFCIERDFPTLELATAWVEPKVAESLYDDVYILLPATEYPEGTVISLSANGSWPDTNALAYQTPQPASRWWAQPQLAAAVAVVLMTVTIYSSVSREAPQTSRDLAVPSVAAFLHNDDVIERPVYAPVTRSVYSPVTQTRYSDDCSVMNLDTGRPTCMEPSGWESQ